MIKKLLPLFVGLLIFSSTSFSQQKKLPDFDYEDPKEYIIGGVTVTGVKYLDKNILVSITELNKGETIKVPGDKITKAIEKLWKQGLFSDIKISATKVEDNPSGFGHPYIHLEIYLQERPRLSRVEFEGIKKTHIDDLKEKIDPQRGRQITDDFLINASNIIKDYFIEKGYLNTDVNFLQINDTVFVNSVILKILVDKKERVKIQEINFKGNDVFSYWKLRRTMKETKPKCWWNFKRSKFIEEDYEEDLKNIIKKYNEMGYRDAKIVHDTVYDYDNNSIAIDIVLQEGNKYYFGDINWVGNTKYTSQQLQKALGIKKGDVFNQEQLDNRLTMDPDAVGNIYLDDGYLFYNCTPVETAVENDTIDMEMRIYEGKQATINSVTISGNTRTNDHVIRREIRSKPGELFSKSDITRTIRELAQLGYFDPEKLNVNPMPNPEESTVDIEYIVEEKASDQVELSGGWGAGMIVGTVGLRFSNFSARNIFKKGAWRPVPTGDGQQLSLRAQTNGKYYQSYNISFVEPWLGGKKPNSFSISAYHSIRSTGWLTGDADAPSMKITGAAIGLGTRLKWPDDYFTFYNEISFQKYNLNNWTSSYIPIENGNSNNVSYQIRFSRSSIDNPLYTRSGSSFSLSLQITPPYSAFTDTDYSKENNDVRYKWIEYHKWKFKADWFTRIIDDLVLRTKAEFGLLGYYDRNRRSPYEGFNVGGDGMGYYMYGVETIGLRGYANGALTPAEGANIYNKLTTELRYPLSLNPSATIYAMLYLEGGNAWTNFEDFSFFKIHRAAGVGVRIFLPMLGMMGIDWGYGFDPIPGKNPDQWSSQWHFVLGQQF